MKRTNHKACPWCGWRNIGLMEFRESAVKRPVRYAVRCEHCGLTGKKSRFKSRARWLWKQMSNPIAPTSRERRYHIYGREF